MSFSGVFQLDMSPSFVSPPSPPSQAASPLPLPLPLRAPAQAQTTYTPTFRVPYYGAPKQPSPPSFNPFLPPLLPVADARTRRWVTAHARVAPPSPIPSIYSSTVEEEKSVFSDDSDLESLSPESSHPDQDDSDVFGSDDDDDDDDDDGESAIFMTRNHSHLRLRSKNPSTASLAPPPTPPRGRPAVPRLTLTTGLRPITPSSAAPVILDRSRARGLSSAASASSKQAHHHHPRSSPSFSSLVAPSLTTDDSDESSTPSVSESIPIPSALSRGRCRPSRVPPVDDDSDDERWWMPSPPDAARKERQRAARCGAFWDGWMRTADYA